MSTSNILHMVLLDVSFDAQAGGLCACASCLAHYTEAWSEGLQVAAAEAGLACDWEPGSYEDPRDAAECGEGCEGECEGLWQEAHDRSEWSRSEGCVSGGAE